MKKFGIRTEGTELEIEQLVKDYIGNKVAVYNQFLIDNKPKEGENRISNSMFSLGEILRKPSFSYYEIGTAEGFTLKAIGDIFKENNSIDYTYQCNGLDLVNGWSLNLGVTSQIFQPHELAIYVNGVNHFSYLTPPKTRLLLFDEPRAYTKTLSDESLDIVLVDGCHRADEVIKDFESVESKVKMGGLVLFHDFGEPEQGTDPQHGGGFIDVRKATETLNLLHLNRPGWTFVTEIKGSRYNGGEGNSFGVFRRI